MPVQFLEGLFATLRRAGVLQSQRGVKGGYRFARDPAQVTVLEVVEALEGALGADAEPAGPLWVDCVAAVRGVLGGTTIADIADAEARATGATMYHI